MRSLSFAAVILAFAAVAPAASAQPDKALSPSQRFQQLADRFVDSSLAYDPTLAYDAGFTTEVHDRFADNRLGALERRAAEERVLLNALRRIERASLPAKDRPGYAALREQLESDLGLRVCRRELWNVNHFYSWTADMAGVAQRQPVGEPGLRAQALKRFQSVPAYIDVEIANLKVGLARGYSAPKSVVKRVIAQMASLSAAKPEASPFWSPAERDADPAFRDAFRTLIADQINPALRRYHDFLEKDYLPRARDSIAVSELPNGAACYQAFLRANTTLNRTPKEVFDLGQKTVAENVATVVALGRSQYGATDFSSAVAAARSRPEDHFASSDELLAYSRSLIERSREKTAALVDRMPVQPLIIEPQPAFQEQAGVSSHYEQNPDPTKPGIYRIQLSVWKDETKGDAAITVVHEGWPGHHLQIALAREILPETRLNRLLANAAFIEGWARYAERMSEEAGVFDSPSAPILRRVWPARGMVVDPGLHMFGWSRQQGIDYLVESGKFSRQAAEDMIDRIAVMPGQLTAYDSGGLEIFALRTEAQKRLGSRFDIKAFNRVVLEQGVVPLGELRTHVEEWIAAQPK